MPAEPNLTRQDAINLVKDILEDGLDTIYESAHEQVDLHVVGERFDFDELDDMAEALGAEAEGIIRNVLKALDRWEF